MHTQQWAYVALRVEQRRTAVWGEEEASISGRGWAGTEKGLMQLKVHMHPKPEDGAHHATAAGTIAAEGPTVCGWGGLLHQDSS